MSRFDKESFETAEIELQQVKDRNRKLLVIGGLVSIILILLLLRQCGQTTRFEAKYEESDKINKRITKQNKLISQKIEDVEKAYKGLGQTYKNAFSKFGKLTGAEQATIDALLDNLIEKSDNFSETVAEESIIQLEKYIVIIRDRLADSDLKQELNDYKLRVETQRQTIERLRTEVREYEIALRDANTELEAAKREIAQLEDIIANNPNSSDAALRSQLADAKAEIGRLKQEISDLQNRQSNTDSGTASNDGNGINDGNESYEKDVDVRAYFMFKETSDPKGTEVTLDDKGIGRRYYKHLFSKKNIAIHIAFRIPPSILPNPNVSIKIFDIDNQNTVVYSTNRSIAENKIQDITVSNDGRFEKDTRYKVSIRDDYGKELVHNNGHYFTLKKK